MEHAWFTYPAKEGGIYVFMFCQTNELPEVVGRSPEGLIVTAVLHASSPEAWLEGKAIYVHPKEVAGKQFTGLPLPVRDVR